MPTDLTTNNVPFTTPSGTTPFTVDVTNANLMADLTVKDFTVIVNGVINPNSNWTKTSRTVLTYVGTAFGSALAAEVRRNTPSMRVQEVTFANKFNSALWEEELNRVSRRAYEYALNGVGPSFAGVSYVPINAAYNYAVWSADTVQTATRSAVANMISTLSPLESPVFTGNPTAPTPTAGDNDTSLATTAFVNTYGTNLLANSPALGGNPVSTTPADSDSDTSIATTAFVKNQHSRFLARRTLSNQSLTKASVNTAIFNTETYDTDSQYSSTTGIFSCTKPGIWLFSYGTSVVFDSTGGTTYTFHDTYLNYNNSSIIYQGDRTLQNWTSTPLSGASFASTGSVIVQLSNADTMQVSVYPDLNGTASAAALGQTSHFSGIRLLAT
jgi:hypothetical protein